MILLLWTVRDRKALEHANPFCVPNVGVGLRNVSDALASDANSPWRMHPEDYEIYQIGTFDTETGEVSGGDKKAIGLIEDLVPSKDA